MGSLFTYKVLNYFPFGFGLDAEPALPAFAGAFLGFDDDVAILVQFNCFPTLWAFRLRLY